VAERRNQNLLVTNTNGMHFIAEIRGLVNW